MPTKKPKKKTWGGRRPNQTGRPPGTGQGRSTKNISVTLTLEEIELLTQRAEKEGTTYTKLAASFIRAGLEAQAKPQQSPS